MAATTVGSRPVAASADLLRRGLLWLASLGTVGITLELVMQRHWESGLQLVPFAALGGLAVAIALVARPRGHRSILAGRGIGVAVLVTSAIGVLVHVRANYEAAPLDFRYTESWPTTPEPIRWLLAATDTVGPSPSLAAAALAFLALVLLIATLRHPSAERSPTQAAPRTR